MAGFLTSASASLTTGTKLITISGNVDCSFVVSGTAVYLNNILMEGVSGTAPDPSGNSSITLRNVYTGSSIVGGTLVAFNTIEGLRDAIQRARELAAIQVTNNSQLDIFLTNATTSVDLELPSGTVTVSPYQYISGLVLGNDVKQYAMSQSQFEAIRAQNNEKYAASGFVHFGKHVESAKVNNGLWVDQQAASANKMYLGRGINLISGNSKTNFPLLNIAGVTTSVDSITTALGWQVDIKFPQAPDGKTTYNKSTGVNTVHASASDAFAAQAADPTNVEVVINRVDMWGFEAWLEEVSTTNPYIYPNGLIQSQATTMEGIDTSASARPVTYYAVFDGDTGSKGKGVNFFALTDTQKKKVLGNHKNNLYYLDDGRLVQWRLRQRSIAGAGNGDWAVVDTTPDRYSTRFSDVATVTPQGKLDVASSSVPNQYYYPSKNAPIFTPEEPFTKDVGAYQIRPASGDLCAVGGQCYFLVCGTVNRLNQGAYHLSFNPSGTKAITDTYGDQNTSALWNNVEGTTKQQFISTAAAFDPQVVLFNSGYIGNPIAATKVRPDGRFYDAIYADGFGGVTRDMRYSAYGVDSVDFAEADQQVKNGTYRGFEKLIRTKVIQLVVTGVGNYAGGHYIRSNVGDFTLLADKQYSLFYNKTKNIIGYTPVVETDNLYLSTNPICKGLPNTAYAISGMVVDPYTGTQVGDEVYLIAGLPMTNSVGGSFLQTDVIGNPANILATPALANGWQGSWLPTIPNNTPQYFTLTRKNISGSFVFTKTTDGFTWGSGTYGIGTSINATQDTLPLNAIQVCQYQAFAKQTENAVNASVYGGDVGVGEVSSTSWNAVGNGMVLLAESCAGIILKSNNGYQDIDMGIAVTKKHLTVGSKLGADPNQRPEHFAIAMMAPLNNSPAFKALNYNVNINQQANIQYAYTELKHNGTNWGDDGKVTIVDNQSTKTDLNGNTVLVGTAKLKESLGWLRLKV